MLIRLLFGMVLAAKWGSAQVVTPPPVDPKVTFTDASTGSPAERLDRAIGEVRSGNYAEVDEVEKLAGPGAAALLTKLFAESTDAQTKAELAKSLVLLGVSDDRYFQFLLQRANDALDTQIPEVVDLYALDKDSLKHPSAAFTAFVDAKHLDGNLLGTKIVYELPGTLLQLAQTTDSRAIPLLRQALLVHRGMFQIMAAMGLAGMRDLESVPLILTACREAPPEASSGIAMGLLGYGSPEIATEALPCLTPEWQKIVRENGFPAQPPFPKPAAKSNPADTR